MKPTVERLCNALNRHGLLAPEQIRTLRQRWLQSAGAHVADGERFLAWLAANGLLTLDQVAALLREEANQPVSRRPSPAQPPEFDVVAAVEGEATVEVEAIRVPDSPKQQPAAPSRPERQPPPRKEKIDHLEILDDE
jgi:hypothetical protein